MAAVSKVDEATKTDAVCRAEVATKSGFFKTASVYATEERWGLWDKPVIKSLPQPSRNV